MQNYEKKVLNSDGWSTIPPISTKRTITDHLHLLNNNMTTTYDVGNAGTGWVGLNQLMRTTPPLLITEYPIHIKKTIKNLHKFCI